MSKIQKNLRNFALGAGILGGMAVLVSTPAGSAPSFDGVWSVVIITKEGICDPSYRYPIRITKGNLLNAGNAHVAISGRVAKNGAVVVNVSSGDKTATGTGKLAGKTGGGSWSGGNGFCSGIWQAERRS